MRTLPRFSLLCMSVTLSAAAQAAQPYLVSERLAGKIWRIEDVNGDGDALDIGERTLWGSGFGDVVGLEVFGAAVYAVEEGLPAGNNEVVRLLDTNSDGDALDVGERMVWAAGLDEPRGIARDADANFYVTEINTDTVWRFVDANGDGDALDVGERTLFADAIDGPEMLLPWDGRMLVSAVNAHQVVLLDDTNGDGDALDVAERLAILTGVQFPLGVLDDGSGGLYVTSISSDSVYHATDRNGDGDFLDVPEVLSYADWVYGGLDGPWNMTGYPTGGFLLADSSDDEVLWVRDVNGDRDALDLGEVITFADGIDSPVDIVTLSTPLPGDYNQNGIVDAADYVVWRKTLDRTVAPGSGADGNFDGHVTQADYIVWKSRFGTTAGGSGSAMLAVPEPDGLILLTTAFAGLIAIGRHAPYHGPRT